MSVARLVETVRRLRPSQVGHRLAARLRALVPTRAVPPPRVRWRGLPPLPPHAVRPATFPFDRPEGAGATFAGRVAAPSPTGLAWTGSPSTLERYHAAYAEVVAACARVGDLPAARRWLAAVLPEAPTHAYVRARRVLALVEAAAAGLAEALPIVAVDAAALARAPEWDVRGNHLVANGAALVRAGGAFAGPAARRWTARGRALLVTCAREQVLADGVHYERSPVYQGLVLEHLLIALETFAARGEAPPPGVEAAAARLAVALEEMVLPDGALARWRDGAPGMALPVRALAAWARGRAGPLAAPRAGDRAFRTAGLGIVADGAHAITLCAAPPCPRDLPAHGHADALAYELVLDGVRVVAGAGTAAYGRGPDRDADRRPGAFAGLCLDGEAPADPYDAFRVGARGFVRPLDTERSKVGGWAAAHAGFSRGVAGAVARRTVALSSRGSAVVMDEWAVRGDPTVDAFVPLGPDLAVTLAGSTAVVTGRTGAWTLSAPGATLTLTDGRLALGLGATVTRPVLRLRSHGPFPARRLHVWTRGATPPAIDATTLPGREVRVTIRAGGPREGAKADGVDDVLYLPVGRHA